MNSTCSGSASRILIHAFLLTGIGAAIGIADSQIRPVKLGRDLSAELDVGSTDTTVTSPTPVPAVNPSGTTVPTPTPNPNTTPASKPPVPAPTPSTTTPSVAPSTAPTPSPPASSGFIPTPKDKLPKGQITLAEAKAAFDAGKTNFVDARTREFFAQGHIPGAIRLQLEDFQKGVPSKLALMPRENQTIVYCAGGHCDESERVAEQLEGSGYSRIFIIHDGFPGWKSMGYEVEITEDIE